MVTIQYGIFSVRRRQTLEIWDSEAVHKALEGKPEESHGWRLKENDSKSWGVRGFCWLIKCLRDGRDARRTGLASSVGMWASHNVG